MPFVGEGHHELRVAGLVGQGQLMHAGARSQHALRKAGVVGVWLEGFDLSGDAREGVGEHTLIGPCIDGRAARRHDLAQHLELMLAPGGLVRDSAPVVEFGGHQGLGEPLAQGQGHG